jgi:branched-chain amino acid aminotransferase
LVGIGDRGLTVGFGLFETIGVRDGVPLAFARHWQRLANSGRSCGVKVLPREVLAAAAAGVLERNRLLDGCARLRVTVTGGAGALTTIEEGCGGVTVVSAARGAMAADSAAAVLCPWTRNERDPLAGHKTLCYASNLPALDWARRAGFDEPVLANSRGELCECATANLFVVIGGSLLTPSLLTGCLPGVTRGLVLELARAAGVPLEEVELPAGRMTEAEEAFLTSATRGVQPLRRLGHRELPAPGPVTARLAKALDEFWRNTPDG